MGCTKSFTGNLRNPQSLDNFITIGSMWDLKFRLQSSITPKYFFSATDSSISPSILILSFSGCFLSKWVHFVFRVLILSLFCFSQIPKFVHSFSNSVLSDDLVELVIFPSSAYKVRVVSWDCRHVCISFMYTRNRRGPNMERCGTPMVIPAMLDYFRL